MSPLSELQLDALREVANIGSGNAATSLSAMLGRPVDISVPSAAAVPLGEALADVGALEEARHAVCVPMVGDLPGVVLLLLTEPDAEVICAMFGIEPRTPDARSMLGELGNILATGYINVLATMLGLAVQPAPPQVTHDMLGAIVESVLLASTDPDGRALVIDSALTVEGERCGLSFLFVPTGRGVLDLLERLGV